MSGQYDGGSHPVAWTIGNFGPGSTPERPWVVRVDGCFVARCRDYAEAERVCEDAKRCYLADSQREVALEAK